MDAPPQSIHNCVAQSIATMRPQLVSTQPAARVEHWQRREAEINAYIRDSKDLKNVKLLFVGDSITDFWLFDDNPCFVPHPAKGQRRTRATRFARPGSGIHRGADWHQQHLGRKRPVTDSVFEGVRAVLTALHERNPKCSICILPLWMAQARKCRATGSGGTGLFPSCDKRVAWRQAPHRGRLHHLGRRRNRRSAWAASNAWTTFLPALSKPALSTSGYRHKRGSDLAVRCLRYS